MRTMVAIEWNESQSVGIKRFDEHHKKLFKILSALTESVEKQNGDGDYMHRTLKSLLDYSIYDVAEENRTLAKEGYSNFEQHKEEHEEFITRINDYYSMIHYGSEPPAGEVMEFLQDWIKNHIGKTDREYAAFLIEKGLA